METKDFFSPTILEGKVSLVTGAGRGLGKVMAHALAQAGSTLVLVARHEEEISQTAGEIQRSGKKVLAIKTDITKSDDISKLVEKAMSEFGKIDVLINNAGLNASYVHHKFEDIPEAEWTGMIQTNVTGVFLTSRIVGRTMLAQGSGKIINIASAMGLRSTPERSCYSVSKAAVIQMTRALAVEWAPRGITVNCIAPGSLDLFPDSTDEKWLKINEERKKRIPLGRLGRLDEVAYLSVYLASDASDYMTGETIFIDGGLAVG
jgi:NAD(P)-dependent dehydrogenase (short-subunit alcohol dehydrogenase family)